MSELKTRRGYGKKISQAFCILLIPPKKNTPKKWTIITPKKEFLFNQKTARLEKMLYPCRSTFALSKNEKP